MPWYSAYASAASMPSSTYPTCAIESDPTSGRSDPCSMYSIEMNGVPSCSR